MRVVVAATIVLAACGSKQTHHGPHVMADWSRPGGLFDAPFPSDELGHAAAAAAFPNPTHVGLLEQARALVGEDGGFAATGGIYFQLSAPIDGAHLPDVVGSVGADSPLIVIPVDTTSSGRGAVPGEISFEATPGPYGAPNLLSFVPLQGAPLLPGARYAAIVTTALRTADGIAFEPAIDDDLAPYANLLPALASHGIDRSTIAGLTVFTVGDPIGGLARGRHAALARPLPVPGAFTQTDLFGDFCAYHTTIAMPDFQAGTPPYTGSGGTWQLDGGGSPIFQHDETANLVVTLPRSAPPAGGYPLVVFVRSGGGGDRPLVDHGQQPGEGQPAIEAGEGPARYLARAGFAAIEVDGPLGGMRNPTGADEQTLASSFDNLGAMRDTMRETAIELDVLAHVAVALHLDATDCPAAGTTTAGPANVGFDAGHIAIMGHSTGAWIAPLAAAHEPLFKAMILSGAGGSFAAKFLWKQKPAPLAPMMSTLLQEPALHADDPALSFVQWALEPADPQVYAKTFAARAGDVLMVQGVVDSYMPPNVANAASLSFGLVLAGTALDTGTDPRLAQQRPLGPLLHLVASAPVALPYPGTAGGTRAVVQHPEDGVLDGDEVLFQSDAPKHQYQCYLRSWISKGTPAVDVAATRDAPCP
jgi:dienelactone hydrolase